MSDTIVNKRSFKLQNKLRNGTIVCLPDGSDYDACQSVKSHERFKRKDQRQFIELDFKESNLIGIAIEKKKLLEKWKCLLQEEQSLRRTSPNCNDSTDDVKSSKLRLIPAWLKHDKEVLCFFLYFKETMKPPNNEILRIRKCSLLYSLSNSKIEIKEDREENSGILQGAFLKPIQLLKTNGREYCPTDFKIGGSIQILGRELYIVGCDSYTRKFYLDLGIELPENQPYPVDDYHMKVASRKQAERQAKSMQRQVVVKQKRPDTLQQYLDYDRKVLRFYCVWDDSRQFGLKNRYTLHFFLSDDTVEIRNSNRGKDGMDDFPLLLKRQRLLKDMNNPDLGYLCVRDLICGQFIDVLTRNLLLESCDKFTKDYYRKTYNIKQPTVSIPSGNSSFRRQMVKSLPPYNGFGSEKDSLANCFHLIPKPVKQDLKQFLKNQGKTLKFVAKLQYPKYDEDRRRFVITYFMDDDSCEVYESAKSTPGIVGGKFLERGKYKKPIRKVKSNKIISKELRKLQQTVQEKIKSKMNGGPFGLLRAFRQFAINENCMIDSDGFKIGLRSIGVVDNSSDMILKELFSLYDRTGDGQIDFQEFVDNVMEEKLVPSNLSKYTGRALRASDLYVGAQIKFLFPQSGACSPEFIIIKATKATLELMESKEHVSEFPKSNVEVILKNLAVRLREFNVDIGQLFKKLDVDNKGYVDVKVFGDLLQTLVRDCGITDDPLPEHEVITLTRIYDTSNDGRIDFKEFYAALKSSFEIQKRVKQEADRSKKAESDAFRSCVALILEQIHNIYDRTSLIQKFASHCRSHGEGIPRDLFLFFLRDELGCNISSLFEEQIMLLFDIDCDGRISLNDFINSIYRTDETGNVENSVDEVLKLNAQQNSFNKPGLVEYGAILKSAEAHTYRSKLSLETLVKRFASAFYKKRHEVLKVILTYDYERTGYICSKNFLKVLRRCNLDYPPEHLSKLIKFLFKESTQLDYHQFMKLFFTQDFKTIIKRYGSFISD